MKLVFLGTTAGIPTKERGLSSVALFYEGEVILFDCGEGTQRQLMKSELSFMKVSKIFISHFHGDHFLGISGLIQSFSLNKRKGDLHIYGPADTVKFIRMMTQIGYFGVGFNIYATELKGGEELEFDGYTIKAVEVCHEVPSLGFKFMETMRPGRFDKKKALELGIPEGPLFSKLQKGEAVVVGGKTITADMVMGPARKGRSVLYTGDTRPCDALKKEAEGVGVLIHEATFDSELEERGNKFGHTTARQAARLAKDADVEKLFLTHVSPRYKDDARKLEEEARELFEDSVLAEDFMEYEVKLKKS